MDLVGSILIYTIIASFLIYSIIYPQKTFMLGRRWKYKDEVEP